MSASSRGFAEAGASAHRRGDPTAAAKRLAGSARSTSEVRRPERHGSRRARPRRTIRAPADLEAAFCPARGHFSTPTPSPARKAEGMVAVVQWARRPVATMCTSSASLAAAITVKARQFRELGDVEAPQWSPRPHPLSPARSIAKPPATAGSHVHAPPGVAPRRKVRVDRAERLQPARRMPPRRSHRVLFGDADVEGGV